MTETGWERVRSRLQTVHQRDPAAGRRFEALVDLLSAPGSPVQEVPVVSVGWLLYRKPGRPGSVTLGLGARDGYEIAVEDESLQNIRSTAVELHRVPEELDLALKLLAGTASRRQLFPS